jgi:hypothetical protein
MMNIALLPVGLPTYFHKECPFVITSSHKDMTNGSLLSSVHGIHDSLKRDTTQFITFLF